MTAVQEKSRQSSGQRGIGPLYERTASALPGWAWGLIALGLMILYGIIGQNAFGETDYRALKQQFNDARQGNWVLMPPIPYGPNEGLLDLSSPPPNRPSGAHIFGTDDRGRDVLVRLAYGFNISLTFALLVTIFGSFRLILACICVYSVAAYGARQRTREIGVRMALGAQRSTVYKLVMRQAVWLTAIGLMLGLACSVGVSTLMHKLLFGVEAWDAPTLLAVALILGLAALAASFIPAWRAAYVNPTEALRAE